MTIHKTHKSTGATREYHMQKAILLSILTGGVGQGLLLVTGILTARMLGVEGRGAYALLSIFPLLTFSIVRLGLPTAIVYGLSSENAGFQVTVSTIVISAGSQILVGTGLYFFLCQVYVNVSGWSAGALIFWALPAFIGVLLSDYANAVFQGLAKFSALNLSRLFPLGLISVGYLFLFIRAVHELLAVVIVWSFCTFICGVGFFARALILFKNSVRNREIKKTEPFFRFGLKAALGTTNFFEAFRLDQLAVGMRLLQHDVGIYSAGLAFTNLPRFIAQSTGYVAFPAFAATEAEGDKGLFSWMMIRLSSVLILIVLLLWITAPFLVVSLFGTEFKESIGVMRILVVASGLGAFRYFLLDVARGLGNPFMASIAEIVLISVFVAQMFLFGLDGSLACARMVLISQITGLLLTMYLLRLTLAKRQRLIS